MERNINVFCNIAYQVINDFNEKKHFDNEKICFLKDYMIAFPTSKEVIDLKKWINNLIYNNLFNHEFINNLYGGNKFYFYKLLELFINRPFLDERFEINNYSFISKLLDSPIDVCGCYRTQVERCMEYFKKIEVPELTNEYEQEVEKFIDEDLSLIRGNKDDYTKSFKEEFSKYKSIFQLDYYQLLNLVEFKIFKRNNDELDINELISKFYNKLLGNVGEYFFITKYRDEQNLRFVARDIGNGAGYDIYFRRDSVERLIEVKTTTYYKITDHDDSFYISKNEYDRMLQVFKENFQAKFLLVEFFIIVILVLMI